MLAVAVLLLLSGNAPTIDTHINIDISFNPSYHSPPELDPSHI